MEITKEFMYGMISGSFGLLLSHPFDTIKTRLQNNQNININPKILYRGFMSPLLGIGIEKSIVFGTYNNLFKLLNKNGCNDTLNNIISGGTSGFFASFIVSPYERIKILYQSNDKVNKYELFNRRELFRGLSATFTREVPGFSIYFSIYEYLKKKNFTEKNKTINNLNAFLYGGIAGASSWIFIYPQDLIKTKIQASVSKDSYMKIIISIIKKDGFCGLYKGFHYALLRAIPLHSGVFMMNEWLKKPNLIKDR
jgi:hypothetical protein